MDIQCPNCFEYYDSTLEMCPHCGYVKGELAAEALHMNPGSILQNRYCIGRVLGFGGFGVTYLAWDMVLETKVAIKEYLPSEFSTRAPGATRVTIFSGNKEQQFQDGMARFVAEAKFQQEPGIVRIYDSFSENNTAYIVMEYLKGETLTAFLEWEKTLSADVAIGMLTLIKMNYYVIQWAGVRVHICFRLVLHQSEILHSMSVTI